MSMTPIRDRIGFVLPHIYVLVYTMDIGAGRYKDVPASVGFGPTDSAQTDRRDGFFSLAFEPETCAFSLSMAGWEQAAI